MGKFYTKERGITKKKKQMWVPQGGILDTYLIHGYYTMKFHKVLEGQLKNIKLTNLNSDKSPRGSGDQNLLHKVGNQD